MAARAAGALRWWVPSGREDPPLDLALDRSSGSPSGSLPSARADPCDRPGGGRGAGLFAGCSDDSAPDAGSSTPASASVDPTQQVAENVSEFSYEGEDGKTALELLEEKDPDAQVQGEGENAYVTAIQGR